MKNKTINERVKTLITKLKAKYDLAEPKHCELVLQSLFGKDKENCSIYIGIILETMAMYHNDYSFRRRFAKTSYGSQVMGKLQNLLDFFSDMQEDNLQAFLDILELETNEKLTENFISNLELRHFGHNYGKQLEDIPF